MFNKIAKAYLKIVETICVILLFTILCCMVLQIVCRLFTINQAFTEELARICFCIIVFLGAPLALAEGIDVAVDMIVNNLPAPARRITDTIVNLLVALFAGMALKSLTVYISANVGVTAVSMTWLKMNWIYSIFFFGFVCLLIISLIKLFCGITGRTQTMDINAEAKAKALEEEKELDLGV